MTRPRPADAQPDRHPVILPRGYVAGADLLAELPPEHSMGVCQALRAVLLWAGEEPQHRAGLFHGGGMEQWEEALLRAAFDPDLRMPLAVIVGELAQGSAAAPSRLSWACLCVAEWALARRSFRTGIAYAEAAALASPDHPRYAYVAGRLLRTYGRLKEAGEWLQRAVRVAARREDWEAQSRGLSSLGQTRLEQGDYHAAARHHHQALRTLQRRGLDAHEGPVLHDLFVIHYAMGDSARAEEYARRTFAVYQRERHARLPILAHDVAFLWVSRGYFHRALAVLRALEPVIRPAEDRMRLLGSTARAAGGAGERDAFEGAWSEGWALAGELGAELRGASTALVEMGLGASSLGEWARARAALERAQELATARGERDVVMRAEEGLAAVGAGRAAETTRRAHSSGRAAGDLLAEQMVTALAAA